MQNLNDFFRDSVWIGAAPECQSPIIFRKFEVFNPHSAILTMTGLGYFDVRINSKAVTQERFLPVASDYEPRNMSEFAYPLKDVTTKRIYCYRFDISHLLQEGENILEIQLGNGWYRQTERIAEGDLSFGDILKTIYRLDLETDKGIEIIVSDGSENWRESEIRYNNIFHGEVIDPRAVKEEIYPVLTLPFPETLLTASMGAADREMRRLRPACLGTVGGKIIYDAGENISGVVRIRTSTPAGSRIVLRFAEELGADGGLDFASTGAHYISKSGKPQIMQDEFISDGVERYFEPRFVWHAFRYFDVEGDIDSAEVIVIHSDTPLTASFSADSEGLEFLFDAFVRTQQGNMHGSFPSDCPHRERLGYTGDGQVCAPAAMMMFDSRDFYRKWIQDILDCQDKESGHVQHTAPLMGGGGGPGGWGSAIVLVPYAFYLQYGDRDILTLCYEPMSRWIKYLQNHCENGLVTSEEEGGWCLGEWGLLNDTLIPDAYVNSCYFVKNLRIVEEIAHIIGREEDIEGYVTQRKITEQAIVDAYRDPNGKSFVGSVQGADAYAVWCGIAGEETAACVAEKYTAARWLDTGFLGTNILFEVLFDHGYADIALQLLENEEMGSYLYMKRNGATTLWEYWHGNCSHNHPMYGACSVQLFTSILGIRQYPGTAGYRHIIIEPRIPKQLKRARGSINTPMGKISVSWEQKDGKVQVKTDIPDTVKVELRY